MIERLYRVEAPHFCAGLVVSAGLVVAAAPILHWTMGKQWVEVLSYTETKGWNMRLILRPAVRL